MVPLFHHKIEPLSGTKDVYSTSEMAGILRSLVCSPVYRKYVRNRAATVEPKRTIQAINKTTFARVLSSLISFGEASNRNPIPIVEKIAGIAMENDKLFSFNGSCRAKKKPSQSSMKAKPKMHPASMGRFREARKRIRYGNIKRLLRNSRDKFK